ncbi:hypothetical protein BWQ96_08033 [Gracilariopsis chorda]|uniref:Uncharacterized protein n=1 Tax=Gracilariopsis chorda TaxID=448386 RepID=A0A2V3IJI1_9FLOR|nr:hypothetical protein BWQ96_08033 [Gracilariopsis chorda]|eukprot:PXF42237.1 hypothetical protein BWQ96_08033 [Gracilariopsis chorda]
MSFSPSDINSKLEDDMTKAALLGAVAISAEKGTESDALRTSESSGVSASIVGNASSYQFVENGSQEPDDHNESNANARQSENQFMASELTNDVGKEHGERNETDRCCHINPRNAVIRVGV